jgi:hypothetical protein
VASPLAEDGHVLVADERVADALTAPGDLVERFMYGWSILHCLPATLAEHPAQATGTVLRTPTVARWAAAAGFTGFQVLPIDNPFWRFYHMHVGTRKPSRPPRGRVARHASPGDCLAANPPPPCHEAPGCLKAAHSRCCAPDCRPWADVRDGHWRLHTEVITDSAAVAILLPGADALRVRWDDVDKSACNGAAQDDDRRCTCPPTLTQRRAAAKLGLSCQPRAEIRFRLRDDPALGVFNLVSEDWSFVEQVMEIRAVLRGIGQAAAARLSLLRTMHTLRSGRVLACPRRG